ncbi:MAG: epoxyqueuosine reductase QueH [Thermodesulfobacteriota bacterium]
MKILLHICCGPCAVYPLKNELKDYTEVCGFFYNPNIHPYQEYLKRLEAVNFLAEEIKIKMFYKDEYEMREFLSHIANNVDNRCQYCYSSRLEATAIEARYRRFDAFSSSLLYSKYQEHELIKTIGESMGEIHGVPFLYRDFRAGWKKGIELSKEMGLYRQQYCGCIYSEEERYK